MTELFSALKFLLDFAWISALSMIILTSQSESGFTSRSEMQVWRKRLERMYGQGEKRAGFVQEPYLGHVLQYLSALLSEVVSDMNCTASDLMSGIILLNRKRSRNRSPRSIDAGSEGHYATNSPTPIATLNEITHLFEFAEMTYGAPERTARRLLHFLMRVICPSFFMPVHHMDISEADFSTLPSPVLLTTKAGHTHNRIAGRNCKPPPDLIFCSVQNLLFMVPFVVLCDNCCKTVVISIRGTLSIRDFFVDLYIDSVPLHFENSSTDQKHYYAHSGFLRCALNVREKLISTGILGILFSEDSKYKDYSLTCIGHSLGAAVATLLTYLLRKYNPELPPARCIAYSPPCAVTSFEASEAMNDYVISVVIGHDLISTLTKESAMNLLSEICNEIRNSRQKKIWVLWEFIIPNILKKNSKNKMSEELVSINDGGKGENHLNRCGGIPTDFNYRKIRPSTVLAGRILHIIPRKNYSEAKCDIVWGKKEDFYDIIIDYTTLSTHIPSYAKRFFNLEGIATYPLELRDSRKSTETLGGL